MNHGLNVGMLNMLPTIGSGCGPGGSLRPRARAFQATSDRAYRATTSKAATPRAAGVESRWTAMLDVVEVQLGYPPPPWDGLSMRSERRWGLVPRSKTPYFRWKPALSSPTC